MVIAGKKKSVVFWVLPSGPALFPAPPAVPTYHQLGRLSWSPCLFTPLPQESSSVQPTSVIAQGQLVVDEDEVVASSP